MFYSLSLLASVLAEKKFDIFRENVSCTSIVRDFVVIKIPTVIKHMKVPICNGVCLANNNIGIKTVTVTRNSS